MLGITSILLSCGSKPLALAKPIRVVVVAVVAVAAVEDYVMTCPMTWKSKTSVSKCICSVSCKSLLIILILS